jgi:hypothetical protein
MEIEITQLLETDMFTFSHSCAEGGENAGPETWNAALNGPRPLLKTPEEFDAFRDFVKDSGGWDDEEIAAWDENELQALFLQWIAGDTREAPALIEGVTFYERAGEWFYDHESTPDEETGPFESRSEAYQAAASEHYRRGCYPSADTLEEIDWQEYEAKAQAGQIPSRLFKTETGKIYFYIGN